MRIASRGGASLCNNKPGAPEQGQMECCPLERWSFDTSKTGSVLMQSWTTWLLIAAGTLTGLVAGAGLGRYALNVPTTSVESPSPPTQDNAANNAGCCD